LAGVDRAASAGCAEASIALGSRRPFATRRPGSVSVNQHRNSLSLLENYSQASASSGRPLDTTLAWPTASPRSPERSAPPSAAGTLSAALAPPRLEPHAECSKTAASHIGLFHRKRWQV